MGWALNVQLVLIHVLELSTTATSRFFEPSYSNGVENSKWFQPVVHTSEPLYTARKLVES